GLFHALLHLLQDLFHFLVTDGRRLAAMCRTDETGDLGGVLHQVPGLVVHFHFDQDIAREEFPLGNTLLPALHFHDLFGRDHDAPEFLLHAGAPHALFQSALHRLFKAGIGMYYVPAHRHRFLFPVEYEAVERRLEQLVDTPQKHRHEYDEAEYRRCGLKGLPARRPHDLAHLFARFAEEAGELATLRGRQADRRSGHNAGQHHADPGDRGHVAVVIERRETSYPQQ